MIYGYASIRPQIIITHLIGYDLEQIEIMEDHSHRFDTKTDTKKASFVHLSTKRHEEFVKLFDIHLVESKHELNFLKKLLT